MNVTGNPASKKTRRGDKLVSSNVLPPPKRTALASLLRKAGGDGIVTADMDKMKNPGVKGNPNDGADNREKDSMKKSEALVVKSGDPGEFNERKDVPNVRYVKRGSMEKALDAVSTAEGRKKATQDLEQNMFASGTAEVRDASWSSWCRLHDGWFGPGRVDYLPLTVGKIKSVGAAFRAGDYRSFHNYVSMAVDQHVMEGHAYPESMRRMTKRVTRAVDRGKGPAAQAIVFNIMLVWGLALGSAPVVSAGPVWPALLMVVDCFFLTREVEIAGMNHEHVAFDRKRKVVTVRLPASKTDSQAKGAKRSWGCVCSEVAQACAYCALDKIVSWAVGEFGADLTGRPVFHTSSGERPSKKNVIKSMIEVIRRTGEETQRFEENLDVTGHSMRVTGAQWLAGLGLEVFIIQLLGRWGGATVARYVADAPLQTLTRKFKDKALADIRDVRDAVLQKPAAGEGSSSSSQPCAILDDTAVRKVIEEYMNEVDGDFAIFKQLVADDIAELQAKIAVFPRFCESHIRRSPRRRWHKVATGPSLGPLSWRTRCGWAFASSAYEVAQVNPPTTGVLCRRCFGLAGEQESTESSGSS